MTSAGSSTLQNRLPLARVFLLMLAGAFVGLMADIRVEHVDIVRKHSIAWLPIVYSGFMTVACLAAFVCWNKIARRVMLLPFFLTIVVGGVGFYLHNSGNLRGVIKSSIAAWTDPNMTHSDDPPQVAPLAFAGLGAIGIVISLDRFSSEK